MSSVRLKKTYLFLLLPAILALGLYIFFEFNISRKVELKVLGLSTAVIDTRPPEEVEIDGKIKVKYPQDYTIVFLGDSMTEKLGNFDELRLYLNKYFPGKSFALLNYGFGSTNILSGRERLDRETFHGRTFRPILDITFDVIIIESFGHNPLSELPLDEGLREQTRVLDEMMGLIRESNPSGKVVFSSTLAPSLKRYAEGAINLSSEERRRWAEERRAYIKNHIDYAQSHSIPLINVYEKSLKDGGEVNLDYIDSGDYIHPSASGIYFISEMIAKSLYGKI